MTLLSLFIKGHISQTIANDWSCEAKFNEMKSQLSIDSASAQLTGDQFKGE
jgi:hypothetical protein